MNVLLIGFKHSEIREIIKAREQPNFNLIFQEADYDWNMDFLNGFIDHANIIIAKASTIMTVDEATVICAIAKLRGKSCIALVDQERTEETYARLSQFAVLLENIEQIRNSIVRINQSYL